MVLDNLFVYKLLVISDQSIFFEKLFWILRFFGSIRSAIS